MFRILVRPFINNSRRMLLPQRMHFSQLQTTSKLQSELLSQINYEENNQEDLSTFINFFANLGFSINYNDIQIQMTKNTQDHDIRVLFNAKTPESQSEENQEEQEEQTNSFQEISVFIKKKNSQKWMCADFMQMGQQSQLSNVFFSTDYAKLKQNKYEGKLSKQYMGPDISTIEESLENALLEFIETLGINQEVISRASEFSIAYEQKFYIQWLKDLNSLL